jgi:hypothetical protein
MDIHNDLSMAHKGKLALHLSTRSNMSVKKNARKGIVCIFNKFIYFYQGIYDYYYYRCCFDKKLECDQSPPVITILHGTINFKCCYCSFFFININHEYAMREVFFISSV